MSEQEATTFLESVDLCFNRAASALKLPKDLLVKYALAMPYVK
jgi:hypothetical protein